MFRGALPLQPLPGFHRDHDHVVEIQLLTSVLTRLGLRYVPASRQLLSDTYPHRCLEFETEPTLPVGRR